MHNLTRIRSVMAIVWSIVLLTGGAVMWWTAQYGITIRVWHLWFIVPAIGGLSGLTLAWLRDELHSRRLR